MIPDVLPIPRELIEPINAAVPDGVTHIGFIATNTYGHVLITEPKGRPYGVSATFSKVRLIADEKPHETLHRCIRVQIGQSPAGIYPIQAVWITPNSRHFYFAGMLNLENYLPSTKIVGLRWCDADSAKQRINASKNAASQQRDLALLEAATGMCLSPARRILLMVRELHLMGFERLRSPAYLYDTGSWHCPIVPSSWTWREHGGRFDYVLDHANEILRLEDPRHIYSAFDGQQPFGWKGTEFASPRELALRFVKEKPEIALAGWGPDHEYARWFESVLEVTAPNGLFYASDREQKIEITGTLMEKGVPMPPPGYAAKNEFHDFAQSLSKPLEAIGTQPEDLSDPDPLPSQKDSDGNEVETGSPKSGCQLMMDFAAKDHKGKSQEEDPALKKKYPMQGKHLDHPDNQPGSASTMAWEQAKSILEFYVIFVGKAEMAWFRRAWTSLENAGLTHYTNEIDRHWVIARAITIGVIYNEFGRLAWEMSFDFESLSVVLYEKREDLGISPSMIEEIAGAVCDPDETEPEAIFNESIFQLVSKCRKPVNEVLVNDFGDDHELFLSLWLSPNPDKKYTKAGKVPMKVIKEAYKKQSAYEYITMGMPGIL